MSEKQLPHVSVPPEKPKSSRGMKTVFAVILALITVPAAIIAFFATCLVTAENAGWGPGNGPIVVGSIAALLTIVGLLYATVRVARGNRPK